MVPIRGTPLLNIWLEICRRAGIGEILVNLHAHADAVRQALARSKSGLNVRVAEEPILLGSAGTILANRDWVANEDCFWVLYADVLTSTDLSQMLARHRQALPVATIGLNQTKHPQTVGIVDFDGNFVVREFVEKPIDPKTNWAFAGIMVASPKILESIPQRVPADLGFDVLPQLAGRMLAYPIPDFVMDIGTMDSYQAAQAEWIGLV
jgi:mannose-1-phosphate guanylyltransferase